MNPPEAVVAWLHEHGHGDIMAARPAPGGCINNGATLQTNSGTSFFLKVNSDAPADMFEREAEGLEALRQPDGPRVPEAYLAGRDFLLLEDLAPGPRGDAFWEEFGRQLGHLHQHANASFGFPHDNYIGSTPQPNPWAEDGYTFFAEHRLRFQARLARHHRWLNDKDVAGVDRIIRRLPDLVPVQPASLIHGDLWSGNATSGPNGEPALIDPAAHYGWAEAELAMTMLFGAFPGEFYAAYEEVRPLAAGWRARMSLYNLYHLLNHLNLFGANYLDQVRIVIRRYA